MTFDNTDGERSVLMITRRSALTATVGGLFATPLIATTVESQQNSSQPTFSVEIVDNTIPAGGSRPLDIRLTNNRDETLTDIQGRFFVDDPLNSTNDGTFTSSLNPGETTTVTVELSAPGGANIKNHAAAIDFRYVDSEGDSKLSDGYRMSISVTEPDNSTESFFPNFTLITAVGGTVVVPVFGYGLYRLAGKRQDRTDQSTADSTTSTTTTETDAQSMTEQSGEDSTTDLDQLQEQAAEAIERAERAADWGDFDMAVDSCEEAITKIEQAIAGIDSDSNQELKTMLTDAQTTLETVTERREQQTEIVEALEPAERSFQEAIVAYIENNQTVARIRFRQARDAFEEVHETITESENDLLGSPTEVSVQPDRELSSTTLRELVEIPEPAADALADAGIETLTDFESSDESPWTPATVEKLVADGAIEEDVATTLTLLSFWHGNEGCEFNTAEVVTRRQEQADYGFNHAS